MNKYDNTLFKDAAWYYARYRPPYPQELFDLIAAKFELNKDHKILDLGAGPGDLAIPLSKFVKEIVAVDPDEEMIKEGKIKAEETGVKNIVWLNQRAEDYTARANSFQLISFGQALHWMNQQEVLSNSIKFVATGGGVAVVSGRSVWRGKEEWQKKTVEVIKTFLGESRRAGKGTFETDKRPHEEVLADFPFSKIEKQILKYTYEWNIEKIIGNLYSTSFATKHLFGDKSEQFEEELKEKLMAINPDGIFTEQREITVILAWK